LCPYTVRCARPYCRQGQTPGYRGELAVGHGVEITSSVLERRISELRDIVGEIDALLQGAWDLPARQNSSRWTMNEAALRFTSTYKTRLSEAEDALRGLRGRVDDMAVGLRETAASFGLLDEQIEADLSDLEAILDNAPEPR